MYSIFCKNNGTVWVRIAVGLEQKNEWNDLEKSKLFSKAYRNKEKLIERSLTLNVNLL